MPDRVIKCMGDQVKMYKRKNMKNLKVLNITNDKYDLDNDKLEEIEGLVEHEVPHPDIISEITGIELDSEQMVPGPAVKENKPTDEE